MDDVHLGGGEKASHVQPVDYSGGGERFARSIAALTRGGQVVLTEPSWVAVQDHLPGQSQVGTTHVFFASTGSRVLRLVRARVCRPSASRKPPDCDISVDMSMFIRFSRFFLTARYALCETGCYPVNLMNLHNTLQVISLGTHLFKGAPDAEPMLLMEVMPSVLAKRSFLPPDTACRVTLGYRDAPEPGPNCVIVFSKVRSGHL